MNTVTMVKTLVVYEVIPEETKMAVVELSQEQFDFLSHAHGYIVNASDVEDLLCDVTGYTVVDNILNK